MKDFSEIRQSEEVLEEQLSDPPMIVVLRRTAIRLFPGNQRVALYTNDHLGIEVSVPYEAGHVGGKKITAVMKENAHDNMFGDYVGAMTARQQQPHVRHHFDRMEAIRMRVRGRWGQDAAGHFHNAATHYVAGDLKKAQNAYQHFERHLTEEATQPLQEGAIHKIHHIAKTGQDGDVIFKNGATARLSAQQALAVIKLHKALTPENKTKLENQVNGSPEEMRKVIEFSNENLK
jgi:hypothetical protein